MKFLSSVVSAFSLRRIVWWSGAAVMVTSMAAVSATQIELWHSLNPHNKQVLEDLVKKFNRESSDVRVKVKSYDSTEAIDDALSRARSASDRPHLVQLDEARLPDVQSRRDYILPLHQLLAKHPIKGVEWFLPAQNTAARDSKGRLVGFPFMLDIPVMFYNIDAFKNAGLNPPM